MTAALGRLELPELRELQQRSLAVQRRTLRILERSAVQEQTQVPVRNLDRRAGGTLRRP